MIFYDFNCIEPNVLSVVAQQMLTIQSAKAQNAIKVLFQETTLKLDASCGIFVTINPDYPGNYLQIHARQKLEIETWQQQTYMKFFLPLNEVEPIKSTNKEQQTFDLSA